MSDTNGRFNGKVAVVTGGNSGIGLATARALVKEGALVAITGRDQASLDAAAEELGNGTFARRVDAGSVAETETFLGEVATALGRIDLLFVNAGIGKFATFETTTEEVFDDIVRTNFRGAYFTIQKALPHLAEGASVVLNATALTDMGMPTTSVYTASKAALTSLGKTVAAELAPRGIRVNVVHPGPITTPIYGRLGLSAEDVEQMAAGIRSQVPLQRFGEASDVAAAVLYLGSAPFVTGAEIHVDGGLSRF